MNNLLLSSFQLFCIVSFFFQATTLSFAAETNQDSLVDEYLELEAVTVTAQKRIQSINDVPIAISVIDQEELDQRHANSLFEMQLMAPNFSVIQNGISKSVSIRGVGGGGRNIGFDTRIGVYLDGVYMGQAPALESPIYDIEQVEILRGPQGYLFGRNTDAGVVNITTRPPSNKFEGYFKTGIGNNNLFENSVSLTGPIKNDLFGKVTLNSQNRDGFVNNTFNHDDLQDLHRLSGRAQMRYLATDQLTLDFSADYSNIHHTDLLPQAVTGLFDAPLTNILAKNNVNLNTHPSAENEMFGAALKADYEMTGGHTLTSITAFRRTKSREVLDTDYSTADLIHVNFSDKYLQETQEIRIASPVNQKLRYVLGAYVDHEHSKTNRNALFGTDTSTLIKLPTLAFSIPFDAAFGILPNAQVPHSGNIKTEAYALFGSLDVDLTKDLTLNLGARYNNEFRKLTFDSDGTQSGALSFATLKDFHDHRQDQFFSPMFGLTLGLSNNLNAYAKYSRGFKSGGWNVDFLSTAQVNDGFSFDKETVNNYEIGLKGESDNHRIQYDLALFHQQYNDFQVFQFVDLGAGQTVLQLKNAAKAESKGLEASVRALLSSQWSMTGGIGILDAYFVDFPSGAGNGQNAAGNRLPDAPRLNASISTNYTLHVPALKGKFNFYVEDTFQSQSYSGLSSDQTISKLEPRNLVNAKTSFITDDKHWEFAIWARNLFDKNYAKGKGRDFFGNQVILYGDPRFYGVTGQYNF
ncbi:MAG: TonB-dependent receptor [Methylotenera sp.]|nr:TonB-dependent receptor [Methylotenera sp.]